MKLLDAVLILEESDIDDPQAVRGCTINLVLWPSSRKHNYRDTKAWAAVYPMIWGRSVERPNGVFFYDKSEAIE